MNQINEISRLDLNLLVHLQALLEEGSVAGAAKRNGVSQPAMGQALGRLRALFDDPLLVRGGRGMLTTARADSLREPLGRVLGDARRLVEPPEFSPGRVSAKLRIAVTDYTELVLLPGLVGRLRREAPTLELCIEAWGRASPSRLERGELDLALHGVDEAAPNLYRRRLFSDRYSCIVRTSHPVARGGLTLERYLEIPHAEIADSASGDFSDPVREALRQAGHERPVALRLASFQAACAIVVGSDLALTLPRRLGERFAASGGLEVLELPLALPTFGIHVVWHERRHHDPLHTWLRGLLGEMSLEAAPSIEGPSV
jgi:DNA-binding transcriptional LysR family regulator